MKKILKNIGSYLLPIVLSSFFPTLLLAQPPSFLRAHLLPEATAGAGSFSGAASPTVLFSFLSLTDKEPKRPLVGNMMALLKKRQEEGCSYKTKLLMQEWLLQEALSCLNQLRAAGSTAADFAQGLGVKWEGEWGNIALVFDELVLTVDWRAEARGHLARVYPLLIKERFLCDSISVIELQGESAGYLPDGALLKFFNATTLRFTYPRLLRMHQQLSGSRSRGPLLPDDLQVPCGIRKVDFADCDLEKLPTWLEELPALEEVNLVGNPRLVKPTWLVEKIKSGKIILTPDEGPIKRLALRAPAQPSTRSLRHLDFSEAAGLAGAGAGGLLGWDFVRREGGVAESSKNDNE